MTTTNDITGDSIKSRANTRSFEDNFDKIFKKQGDYPTDGKTTDKQRNVLAASNGPVSGVDGACSDHGNTDIEYDGGVA